MHYRILAKLLGLILGIVSAAMALCFLVAWAEAIHGRPTHDVDAMGFSLLATVAAAALLMWLGWKGKPEDLLRKEALAVVSLGWTLAAIFGSLPFALCGRGLNWVEALFESMSGFTTTGSTVIHDLAIYSDSILLWRSLTQWIGGLGILALVVALLTSVGASSRSLMGQESSMNLSQAPVSRIQDLTIRLWTVYGSLTLACWFGMWILGMFLKDVEVTFFEALLYSLTAVSTGGFAPHNLSVGYYQSPAIEIFLGFFMLVCSLNMILVLNLCAGEFDRKIGRSEAIAFLAIVFIAILTIAVDFQLTGYAENWHAAREAFFPVFSLSTSTGYGNVDYDQWPLFSRCILATIMIIGGCSGSTAGGVKIVRALLAVRILKQEVIKTFRPNQVFSVKLDGAPMDRAALTSLMAFLVFASFILLFSTLAVALGEPLVKDLDTAFGAVIATFFNMGPGFGEVGPTETFERLHNGTLLFLTFLMLLGRLEIYALVAIFYPSLWRKY